MKKDKKTDRLLSPQEFMDSYDTFRKIEFKGFFPWVLGDLMKMCDRMIEAGIYDKALAFARKNFKGGR